MSVIIGAGSIIYTNQLVKKIKKRERRQIDIYASALENVVNESDGRNQIFILEEIINSNTTIPVILTDASGNPEYYKNLPRADDFKDPKSRKKFLMAKISEMQRERDPLEVMLMDDQNLVYGVKYIYYQNSILLKQLQYYPYIQLLIIALFGLITFTIFNYSRTAEQNRVWVGLAKETAHQLGTPLSSLIAWVEYFKATYAQDENIKELNKDIERLEMITARFSSIGSVPQLKEENLKEVIDQSIDYLRNRLSSKINFSITIFPTDGLSAMINRDLFSWIMENLCKNAVDAMEGKGAIDIKVMKVNNGKVAIDVTDTGKGIHKTKINTVFKPGFTTKKRGWGLGLTLVKRIVENYHEGKIFVKQSELNKGTTFRILLNSTST
ncbi:MAG: HAMP domain-containing histidine kinase [Cyclobacteriaceae bacterium]|nr:HAMP domain-containing histidine kinase [Cyclobacteriaceae bacterium HetDA_MAG_MS6]